jgi:hypothetical protein
MNPTLYFFTNIWNNWPPLKVCFKYLLIPLMCIISLVMQAQYFVVRNAPCPRGENITYDTVFYAPDKSMPFDRCFYLKITLNGIYNPKFFAINPIDKEGNLDVRRRDFRVYKRTTGRKNEKWKDFRSPIKWLFPDIVQKVKNNKTELVLNVSPLDPNRSYRIYLIGEDTVAINSYLRIGTMITNNQLVGGNISPPSPTISLAVRELSRDTSRRMHEKIPFADRTKFNDVLTNNSKFSITFNRTTSSTATKYRFFLMKWPAPPPAAAPVLTQANALGVSEQNYKEKKIGQDPDSIRLQFPLNDISGNPIQANDNGIYRIFIMSMASPLKPGNPTAIPDFYSLGDLTLSNNGTKVAFKADPSLPDSKFVQAEPNHAQRFSNINDSFVAIGNVTADYTCFDKKILTSLIKEVLKCPCNEKGIKDLTEKNSLFEFYTFLFENNSSLLNNFKNGLITFDSPSKPTILFDLTRRKSNLSKSISQLDAAIAFAEKIDSFTGSNPDVTNFIKCLRDLAASLGSVRKELSKVLSEQDAISKEDVESYQLYEVIKNNAIGTTSMLDFVSKSKLRIVPDFGFVALLKGNNSVAFQDFTPYLGFNINFREIDKSIPFSMIRFKTWRHRLSFQSGITLRSLKIENEREDFFGSNCLITGLSFRLSNAFRISGGTVWFKTIDPNRLSNDKPIGFSPYIGISLDLELQDLFGGIAKLFK